jgi:hypothetical protein
MMFVLPHEELQLIRGNMPRLRQVVVGPNDHDELLDVIPAVAPVVLFDGAPNLSTVVHSMFFDPFAILLP